MNPKGMLVITVMIMSKGMHARTIAMYMSSVQAYTRCMMIYIYIDCSPIMNPCKCSLHNALTFLPPGWPMPSNFESKRLLAALFLASRYS